MIIQKKLAQYVPIDGLTTQTVRNFRGVNTFDPFSISSEFFTDMKNLTTEDFPTISVRPGFTQLGSAIGSKVLGLGVWKNQELHAVFNDGSWRRWTGSSWTSLRTGLNTTADWSFTNFKGNLSDENLFGCNGVNGLFRYTGSTVSPYGNASNQINFITTYQNRLWGAWGNELHSCALNQPDQWQKFDGLETDSYFINIENNTGENINMVNGGLRKLTIGMPNSLHELYGGVPSDFYVQEKTRDVGFSNNKSAITQDGNMRFIHKTGIYEFTGGLNPEHTFSDIVSNYLSNVDVFTVAGSDGTKMYFVIGDKTLVYDPRTDIQSWSVWGDVVPTCFAVMNNELYIGDESGRVFKLGGNTDAGQPIHWFANTIPFNNVSMNQLLRWHKLWIVVDLPTGSSFEVYGSKSAYENDWVSLKNLSGDATIQKQRILIPVNKIANANYIRLRFEGQGYMKLHGFTYQQRSLPLV